jgi:thiol:disulfide interchange protein DsbC
MMKFPMNPLAVLLSLLAILATTSSRADDGPAVPAGVRQALEKLTMDHQPDEIRAAPISGFYEVRYGSEIFYISGDGHYAMRGDLVDVTQEKNLTETRRNEVRSALLAKLDDKSAIVFSPRGKVKHTIYAFTDVDCPYCRRMHSEIAQYNQRGIEIRYLAYPRSGPNTPSYYKMVSVWCAGDRRTALTRAKAGQPVAPATCKNPVLDHMALADRFGVSGTPTLVMPDGSVLPGYVPPTELADYLDENFPDR